MSTVEAVLLFSGLSQTSNSPDANKRLIGLRSSTVTLTSGQSATKAVSREKAKCETCRNVFAKVDLEMHRLGCLTDDKRRQCRQCGRLFVRRTALEAHEKRCASSSVEQSTDLVSTDAKKHLGGRVPCPSCPKTFTLERSMRAHFATFHDPDPVSKPFSCDLCGRSFGRASLLAAHRRTHSGDRPFQCELCGRRFICRADLNKHHRLHVDGYLYKCRLCGKEIKTSRESADHRRHHAGGIVCPICGKTFTRYLNMKAHVRGTHGGERRFSCAECGKSFVYAQNLRYHRRVHGALHRQQPAATSVDKSATTAPSDLPSPPPTALSLLRLAGLPDTRQEVSTSSPEAEGNFLDGQYG